jgi:hypothetical protein
MTLSASQYVVLEAFGSADENGDPIIDFVRQLKDGGSDAGPGGVAWRVPQGQALVVTDVDWQYVHPNGAQGAGDMQIMRLFVDSFDLNTGGSARQFESAIILSANGEGGACVSMTSGFVVSSKAKIRPDVTPGPNGPPGGIQHIILRGFLIADI